LGIIEWLLTFLMGLFTAYTGRIRPGLVQQTAKLGPDWISMRKEAVEKLKFSKIIGKVGKSVILCQLLPH
jgi:hypothetical protein